MPDANGIIYICWEKTTSKLTPPGRKQIASGRWAVVAISYKKICVFIFSLTENLFTALLHWDKLPPWIRNCLSNLGYSHLLSFSLSYKLDTFFKKLVCMDLQNIGLYCGLDKIFVVRFFHLRAEKYIWINLIHRPRPIPGPWQRLGDFNLVHQQNC